MIRLEDEQRRATLKQMFPNHVEIAHAEASILRDGEEVLKVYGPQYSLQKIQRYAGVTNELAARVSGKVIEINFPDGVKLPFEVEVNTVDGVGVLENGQVFTRGKFINGPNVEEEYMHTVTYKDQSVSTDFRKRLVLGRISALWAIEEGVRVLLDENANREDREAIILHEQNMKVHDGGGRKKVIVTDISSRIRDIR